MADLASKKLLAHDLILAGPVKVATSGKVGLFSTTYAYNLSSGFPIAVNPCCNAAPDACIDNIKTTYTDRWKLGA